MELDDYMRKSQRPRVNNKKSECIMMHVIVIYNSDLELS